MQHIKFIANSYTDTPRRKNSASGKGSAVASGDTEDNARDTPLHGLLSDRFVHDAEILADLNFKILFNKHSKYYLLE